MPGDGHPFTATMPVTLCPPNVLPNGDNSEIGYLRDVLGDVLTITRAQGGSVPMQVGPNWEVIGTVTAKSLTYIKEAVDTKQRWGTTPLVRRSPPGSPARWTRPR
jgi:hypothetical protein